MEQEWKKLNEFEENELEKKTIPGDRKDKVLGEYKVNRTAVESISGLFEKLFGFLSGIISILENKNEKNNQK